MFQITHLINLLGVQGTQILWAGLPYLDRVLDARGGQNGQGGVGGEGVDHVVVRGKEARYLQVGEKS